MRAAILRAPGRMELGELPEPVSPEGGAILEVLACAVCGTDIKMKELGHRDLALPRVLGHEITGRILELDSACKRPDLAEGDLIQLWPGVACGECRPCRRGQDNLCQNIKIMGFNFDGGFAERLPLTEPTLKRGVNPLGKGADPATFTLAEPLACSINAQEKARVLPEDTVLILGGGPVGALHALLAELQGAGRIIVAERLPERIRLIRWNTKAEVFDPSEESIESALASGGNGMGADVIITATPEIPLDQSLLRHLSPGGRACVFSGPMPGHHQERIDIRSIHYHELTITGSYGCTSEQCCRAVELLSGGRIRADWLITKRTKLEGISGAFEHSAKRAGMKSVVCIG